MSLVSHETVVGQMKLPTFTAAGPGPSARIQATMIRAAAATLRPRGGRGLASAVTAIGRMFPADNFAVVDVAGGRLKIDLRDHYWMAPLLRGDGYEPEIRHVLSSVLGPGDAFIDCGANIGYWSVIASRRITDPRRVVAVEASAAMFRRLSENAALNDSAFTCVNAAIWSTSGQEVDFAAHDAFHSWGSADPETSAHLRAEGFRTERIETISIDDLVARYVPAEPRLLVLKVDVEGSEEVALAGAADALSMNTLLVYEDHGRDVDSTVSAGLLDRDEMAVFFCTGSRQLIEVSDIGAVGALKQERERGYNFFACDRRVPIYRTLSELSKS